MKMHVLSVMVGGLLLGQAARSDSLPGWLTERRIIGHNDLEPIEKTTGTAAYDHERVVARVEGSDDFEGFCTGSRVGKDLFLTNYHCFEYKECDHLQFHLGYEKELGLEKQLLFKCKEVLAKNITYDYALYRVEFVSHLAPEPGDAKTYGFKDLDLAIPDDDAVGVTKDLEVDNEGDVVDLELHLVVEHSYASDLKILLTSPAGKVGTVFDHGDADGNLDRTFNFNGTMRSLKGESAKGTWKLQLIDAESGDKGALKSVEFTVSVKSDKVEPVKGLSPADYPIAEFFGGELKVGQMLTLAGHPDARLKEIDRGNDCKLVTVQPKDEDERQTIRHTCDTEGGSSGSPVLDRETGRIVALHWGGTNEYNMAIPISLVLKDIQEHVPAETYGEFTVQP